MAAGVVGPGYQPLPGCLDEMLGGDGQVRPHWQSFLQSLQAGPEELTQRWEEAKQLIRENGVTYNVYGDPRGMDRPWHLDPIPLLVSAQESRVIETNLIQRPACWNCCSRTFTARKICCARACCPRS